jgi:hypothetical protein
MTNTSTIDSPRDMEAENDRHRLHATHMVEATDCESQNLWEKWHARPQPGRKPLAWEQISLGEWREIGKVAGRPICVTVHYAIVEGALVAFYEGTSELVDHAMIEAWLHANFPAARSWSNAMNFHNTVLDIERQKS